MTAKTKRTTKFTGKKMIGCLVAWFVICMVFYAFIHILEENRRQELIKTGVSISKDISSQSGLLLLEENIKSLSHLLEKIKKRPEVVFASIIDHKNKIIAYTDQDQFFALNREKSGVLDDVHYWRISNLNHQKIMNFSSKITFSDTKVGEAFISIAAKNIGQLNRFFIFFSAASLLGMIFLFGIVNYKDSLSWWNNLDLRFRPGKKTGLKDLGDAEISCPLCGSHEHFSVKGFQPPNLDKFPVLRQYTGTNPSILLKDIAKMEELSWLRRVIVIQCTRIIKKVTVE